MTQETLTDQLIKACCADFYQSDLVRSLLGETLHPGGLELTQKLGETLQLEELDRVLDVAAGPGASAIFLARTFGCQVVGIDYGEEQVSKARRRAFDNKLFDKVTFRQGDAENLKDYDGTYDAAICECALSTFPNKPAAVAELHRVLRPGGRVGITDVTLDGPLPPELSGVAASVACIGMALSREGYQELFSHAGFANVQITDYSHAIRDLVKQLQTKVMMARLAGSSGIFQVESIDLKATQDLLMAAEKEIKEGHLGYIMLTAAA